MSNGDSGGREYIELVAIGPPGFEGCGPVDLRGFILDDNNGDFSGGALPNAGIAFGHIRFSPSGPWSAVPAGAILLIYYSNDKNTSILLQDDPYDSNNDSVYIIPDSNSNLQRCTSVPNSSNSAYSPASYSSGSNLLNTNGMRNLGDAAQVRNPNGTYFHGFGFGDVPLNGGPDNIYLSGSGLNSVINFTNTISDDYRLGSNFTKTMVPVNETPGLGNGLANSAWIQWLRTSCNVPLASYRIGQLFLIQRKKEILVEWEPGQMNGNYFLEKLLVQESPRDCDAVSIHSELQKKVFYSDNNPVSGANIYRIRFEDANGNTKYSAIKELFWEDEFSCSVFPNPSTGIFQLKLTGVQDEKYPVQIISITGTLIAEFDFQSDQDSYSAELNLSHLPAGVYFLQSLGKRNWQQKVVLIK